jgi:hypothetical protein
MMPFPYDFVHLWASARIARLGGNPYDPQQIAPLMAQAGWPPEESISGFMHPFWSLALMTPFSLLPFSIAAILWELAIIVLVVASLLLLRNEAVRRVCGQLPSGPNILLVTALFPPLLSTLAFGQSSAVLLLGCAGWLSFFCRGRFFTAGVLLSLTTLKPQLFVPLYVWVFLSQLRGHEWRTVTGFGVGLFTQISMSLLIAPESANQWFIAMRSIPEITSNLPTPALGRIIASLLGVPQTVSIVMLIAGAGAAACALGFQGRVAERAVLFFIPLGLLTTAYVWSHSFLVLLLPWIFHVARLERIGDRPVLALSLVLATWGILEICYVHFLAPYSCILPLTALVVGLRALRAPSESPTRGE